MSLAQILDLLGLGIGLVSAVFFSRGATDTSAKTIIRMCASGYGGYSQHLAEALAHQKADYLIGSLLLLLSFLLQLASSLIPQATLPEVSLTAAQTVLCLGLCMLLLLGLGVAVQKRLSFHFSKQVEAQRTKLREESPRQVRS